MGGMIGFNNKKFIEITGISSFDEMINAANFSREKWNTRGADQDLLMTTIWPKIKHYSHINVLNEKKIILEHIELGLNDNVNKYGDSFCCYIGSCGINYNIKKIIDFYDENGNTSIIKKIKEIEKSHIQNIYDSNLYYECYKEET